MAILKENNELEKRANKHKKKNKGLGWYIAVNPDKGNPKSMEIFNNSTADGGIGEVTSMGENLKEDKENKITLYYSKLPVERFSNYTPATYWEPGEYSSYMDEVEYEYKVDKSDIEEIISDIITEEDYPEYNTATDEEFWKFISDNFDTLFNKYEKQILDKYEKDAIEEWEDKYYFDESLKESLDNDISIDEYDDTPHICNKCGYKLNDAGECPICDLGDYTALDEELSISEALFRLKD